MMSCHYSGLYADGSRLKRIDCQPAVESGSLCTVVYSLRTVDRSVATLDILSGIPESRTYIMEQRGEEKHVELMLNFVELFHLLRVCSTMLLSTVGSVGLL